MTDQSSGNRRSRMKARTAAFNSLMLIVDGTALFAVAKIGVRAPAVAGILFLVMLAGVSLLGGSRFHRIRLAAYGLLLHGGLVLAGAGLLAPDAASRAGLVAATGLVVLVAVDAFLLEPTWLEVSRREVVSPKLKSRVRIAVVADFQADRIGAYERKAVRALAAASPDVILFTGDYLQPFLEEEYPALSAAFNTLLKEADLKPRLGVFAVAGNMDSEQWPGIFSGTPVTVMAETRTIDLGELALTGIAMADSYRTDLDIKDPGKFHVVFGHCPNFSLGMTSGDLLLAGHTHGGQIRLPFLGPLMTFSRIPRRRAAGMSNLGGGRRLVVSRGVGMERGTAPRLRLLCRPELALIDLLPA